MEQILKQKAGSIVYSFAAPYDPRGNIIYVNVVPKYSCVNSCRFCSREDAIQGKPNIYEKKAGTNLYLPKTPSVDEIVNEIEANRKRGVFRKTKEIAFVGLGEPLLEFETVRDSIRKIRERGYKEKIRVDTNGLVKSWYGSFPFGCLELVERNPARELRQAGLDEVRVSVNATSEEEYQRLCRPPYNNAFENLCKFVEECIAEGIDTKASFVVGFDDEEVRSKYPEAYRNFALSLGIKPKNVILRDHVIPLLK